MKIKMCALLIAVAVIFSGCSKDDTTNAGGNEISVATVRSTATAGTWRVTYFWDTDHDETSNFSGYDFTFFNTGLLMAIKGADHIHGGWNTGTDNSKVKLNIDFTTPADFEEISEDWHVIERTQSRIKLEHVSGGNGGTDVLTFEKN